MKASWKFLALASAALGAAGVAACTVTSGSGDDDGGLFSDSGTGSDTSTAQDSGTTADTGSASCTTLTETVDGGNQELTFDTSADGGFPGCDPCLEQNCCGEFTGCFQDPSGQCQDLNDTCLANCVGSPDAGGCADDCASVYSPATDTLLKNWNDCAGAHCAGSCPF